MNVYRKLAVGRGWGWGLEGTDILGKGMDRIACQWDDRRLGYMCSSISNVAANGRSSEKCNTCIVFCHRKSTKKCIMQACH